MNEQYRQLSKLVGQDVTKRERQQRRKEQEERKVQQLFERNATAQLATYEAGCAEKEARVQERYQEVILPWWGIVVESGLYEQLRKRSEKSDIFVKLNDTIEYYYPTRLYREFVEAPQLGHKPFTWRAEWLLEKVLFL